MIKIGNTELGDFPFLLAPMEDVSDPPFRFVCKQNGADVMYTEFISSEGLIRHAAKSKKKLDIFEYERPIGIQIFGRDINSMCKAAIIAEQSKPDIIDINFGCPVKAVTCSKEKKSDRGAGAALLQNVPMMVKITEEIVKHVKIPVTVKTRLGWDDNTKNIEEVAERLQDVGIQAITIHGRTRMQMYKGNADWTLIGKVKNNPRIVIPIFGNGDVNSPQKAKEMKDKYGVDGIMIGRASIGDPWIFREIKHFFKTNKYLSAPSIEELVQVCRTHLEKSVQWKGERIGILEMRKHYSHYFKTLPNFKNTRMKLVTSFSLEEIFSTLERVREIYSEETLLSN